MEAKGLISLTLSSLSPGGRLGAEDEEGEVGGRGWGGSCVEGLGGRLEEGKGLSSKPSGTSTSS